MIKIPHIKGLSEDIERWGIPFGESALYVIVASSRMPNGDPYIGPIGFFDNELAAHRVNDKAKKLLSGITIIATTEHHGGKTGKIPFNVKRFMALDMPMEIQ